MKFEDLSKEKQRKLLRAEKAIKNATALIRTMGLEILLTPDRINFMEPSDKMETPKENILHSFTVRGWDAGDW